MSLESDLFEKLNTRLLVLTGAGASKPLEMPLMREFHDLVSRKLDKVQRELLHNISLVHMKETKEITPDLEALLALIEKYRGFYDVLFGDERFGFQFDEEWKRWAKMQVEGLLVTDSAPRPDYLANAFFQREHLASLDTLLRNLIFEVYGKDIDHDKLNELYRPLFKAINKHLPQSFIPVFTTNYDTAIETYAIGTDIRLETGFDSTPTATVWKPSLFYQFQPIKRKQNILLFKLHGSLAWHRKDDIIISTGLPIRDPSGYKSMVIYPTQTKEYPDEEPFRTLYDFLKGCFRIVEVVIVIGYSFRDPGIHRIILDALELNPDLFFVFICGSRLDHWKKFAQQNLRSHQIITDYFDFAPSGAPYLKELDKALAGFHR